MKKVMIVDMLNIFYRSYVVDPSLSKNGMPVGGLAGSLKSIQKLCRNIKPDEVILCWDGSGGSKKRQKLNEGYKQGRKPIRLNRSIQMEDEQEELENKIWQQVKTIEYMNLFPFIQFQFEGTEADDVIAFLTTYSAYQDYTKIIVSSDKDYYQLCNDSTIVYRPINRKDENGNLLPNEIVSRRTLLEEHNIHPTNFATARALCGDSSDNLPGVGGVGLKTAAKRFPGLKESTFYSVEDVIKFSEEKLANKKKPIKAYLNVVENQELFKTNYKMMQLYVPNMSHTEKHWAKQTINEFEYTFNSIELMKKQIEDGLANLNIEELIVFAKAMVNRRNK